MKERFTDNRGAQRTPIKFGKKISKLDVILQMLTIGIWSLIIKINIRDVYQPQNNSYIPFFKTGMYDKIVLPIMIILIIIFFIFFSLKFWYGRYTYTIALLDTLLFPAILGFFIYIHSEKISNDDSMELTLPLILFFISIFFINAFSNYRDCKKPFNPIKNS